MRPISYYICLPVGLLLSLAIACSTAKKTQEFEVISDSVVAENTIPSSDMPQEVDEDNSAIDPSFLPYEEESIESSPSTILSTDEVPISPDSFPIVDESEQTENSSIDSNTVSPESVISTEISAQIQEFVEKQLVESANHFQTPSNLSNTIVDSSPPSQISEPSIAALAQKQPLIEKPSDIIALASPSGHIPQASHSEKEKMVAPEKKSTHETKDKDEKVIAQNESPLGNASKKPPQTILINFNNVNVIELIRFISRISNKNFVFDDQDLQFNVTIVSEEPTTVENIMAALLQELRIHNLSILEQGNNLVIHQNPGVNGIAKVVSDTESGKGPDTEIVTRLFRLNTADPEKVATVLRPLVSAKAIIEVFKETNNVIVTDLVTNIEQIAQFIRNIDSPNNGLIIGQYVVRTGYIDALIQLAEQIMKPIAQDQTLLFVPHRAANSIFIVSTPFLIERTLAILQYLDQTQGLTRIFNLKDLKFSNELFPGGVPGAAGLAGVTGAAGLTGAAKNNGQWELDQNGNWIFRPAEKPGVPVGREPPQGYWYVDDQGNWRFQAGTPPPSPGGRRGAVGPEGEWQLDPQGFWVYQLAPGTSISPGRLARPFASTAELPAGHIERTQFYIQKLRYRKGDQVQVALLRIGESLRFTGVINADLVETINSVQWIEASNSLIFTGTPEALDKVRELVLEIDAPLRQVFIEMLILETDIDDSLNYGVDWGTRFGGGNQSGSQAFLSQGSTLPTGLDTTELNTPGFTSTGATSPDASQLARNAGYALGVVGRHITHCGLHFNSIGALVTAIHGRTDTDIIMVPKLLTEDNSPAEIFVGINTRFPTQAIVNNNGNIVTQNFEFRDVGTRFRVTPMIGNNDVITLVIEQEVSSIATSINSAVGEQGPTTNISRTVTRIHLPNEFFLIISGMAQDQDQFVKNNVPCLGGVPFIGAGFTNQQHHNQRRTLMVFIRPRIIDTEEEIDNITKHQQDVFRFKRRMKTGWKYEVDDALDFFNLPNPDDCPCDEQCRFMTDCP